MQRPYEPEIVDALLSSSLRVAMRIELLDSADPPYIAESLAAQVLLRKLRSRVEYDGSVPLMAGFRLATMLCCRILADPLRTHPRGVRRDVEKVLLWLQACSSS